MMVQGRLLSMLIAVRLLGLVGLLGFAIETPTLRDKASLSASL